MFASRSIRCKGWLVSSVVSEAGAVSNAPVGQGPRSNLPSAGPADQTSPFASLLDRTSPPPAAAPPPGAPPPPPSQKQPAPRARDDAPPFSPETAATLQSSDSPAPATQAGAVPPPPAKSSQGTRTAQAALALAALVKAAVDPKSTIDASADAAAANSAADTTAGTTPVDPAAASSTAAAVTDTHGDKAAKLDSIATDTAQLTIPPADPSASQAVPAAPQAVAVAITAPLNPAPAATIGSGSGSGSDGGTGRDAAQIAALGGAVKAGALSESTAGAEAAKSGSAPANPGASAPPDPGGGAKPPDGKIADGIKSTPAPTPSPGQKDLAPPAGSGQPNAADGLQSRNGEAVAPAATDRARQGAAASQPADSTAASQPDSNTSSNDAPNIDPSGAPNVTPSAAPKRDAAASASRTEDITRLALDTAVRHGEAADACSDSGPPRGDEVQLAGNPQSPDGGLIAPTALTTAAAPTAAPTPAPTTIPIAGLAVEIAAHAYAGKNRFEIRLDPPELGRIDVRLDVDRDGKVTSRLVVERPQTLDMLRRDAPELERSLQQAGLKTADNALQFSLRDQGGFGSQNPYSNGGSPAGAARVIIPDRDMPSVDAAGYGRASGSSTGLDIRV
jgi:flagellar hook-length control protein FliK